MAALSAASSESPARCAYLLPHKSHRRCRMMVKGGSAYCGEHRIHEAEDEGGGGRSVRVRCPLDRTHTVDADKLEKHLRHRCNGRPSTADYISAGCNVPPPLVVDGDGGGDEQLSFEQMCCLRDALASLISEHGGEPRLSHLRSAPTDALLLANAAATGIGVDNKHLVQQAAILAHMRSAGCLRDGGHDSLCFVEFGAGRGRLASWLVELAPGAHFVLVDRGGARNKFDTKAACRRHNANVTRVRCAVEDLRLCRLPAAQGANQLVCLCKHLCGCATDYAIECIANAIGDGLDIAGVALAPCCHHKCTLDALPQCEAARRLRLGYKEFDFLRRASSWATCGWRGAADDDDDGKAVEEQEHDAVGASDASLPPAALWSAAEKRLFGQRAKRLIELCRAERLRRLGFTVDLLQYVPAEVTPENVLILATRSGAGCH